MSDPTLTLVFTFRDPYIHGSFGVDEMTTSRPLTPAEERCLMGRPGLYSAVQEIATPQAIKDAYEILVAAPRRRREAEAE